MLFRSNYQAQNTNIYNRLSNLAGLGQSAASDTGTAGSTIANSAGTQTAAAGTAAGAGTVGTGNALASGLSNYSALNYLASLGS